MITSIVITPTFVLYFSIFALVVSIANFIYTIIISRKIAKIANELLKENG